MIPKLQFGRTGHASTRTIFGAVALANVNSKTAEETLNLLFEYGINHIDVARDYGDAELRVGEWMPQHRNKFFLATKTGKRTYKEATDELYDSLKRLQTDYIDLWQMHALFDPAQWEIVMGQGGALEAFIEAKEKGLVRFLGVTGHGYNVSSMHIKSLEKYKFDSVLLPYNYYMMSHKKYAADFNRLLQICKSDNVAVQTIKSLLKGPWGSEGKSHATWYKPLTDPSDIKASVFYAMSLPGIFINTIGDVGLLPVVLETAASYQNERNDFNVDEVLQKINFSSLF